MTIAVGMIGSDGILLAIDRQLVQSAERPGELDELEGICKITDLPDQKVAYARVGDSYTKDAGDMLANSLATGGFDLKNKELALKLIALEAYAQIPNDDKPLLNVERSLLVVFYDSAMAQMWRVRISPLPITAERITTISIRGATGNSARYFRHYFQPNKALDELLFLAAHIVLVAGRVDPLMVDGLDISVFKNGIHRPLTDREMERFYSKSSRIEALLQKELSEMAGMDLRSLADQGATAE